MGKNIFKVLLLFALVLAWTIPSNAQKAKKEKKEKEKKEFVWPDFRPAELSGIEEVDEYILYCDTVWDSITVYKNAVTYYKLDTVMAKNDADEVFYVVKVRDDEGNDRNFSAAFSQYMSIGTACLNLTADAALVTLKAASALTALALNPLKMFTYGKCVKVAPRFVATAYAEAKTIIALTRAQAAEIQSLKKSQLESSTDQAIVIPVDEDAVYDLAELANLSDINLGSNDGAVSIDEYDLDALDKIEIPDA